MRAVLPLLLLAACAAPTPARAQEPGRFDYYLLALSWSPEYCASRNGARDKLQCVERQYGFVTHGLWPQFEKGYPSRCPTSQSVSRATVAGMLDIMPSPALVRHEWTAHGACSGLTPADYYATVRRFYSAVRIPREFQQPAAPVLIEPAALKKRFLEANPALAPASLAVVCSGRNLREVRVCFTREGKPRPCGRDVRDQCTAEKVLLRPVR